MAKFTVSNAFLLSAKLVTSLAIAASSLFAVSDSRCIDCDVNQVCCYGDCIDGPNCLGHYCDYNEDCNSGEFCCNFACTNKSSHLGCLCNSYEDCSVSESCCGHVCVNRSSCLGLYCENDAECSMHFGEKCCSNVCSYSHTGLGCYCQDEILKCSSGESCCDNICVNRSSCGLHCNNFNPKCSNGESCCSNKCVKGSNCLSQSCKVDSHCSSDEHCCSGKCVTYCSDFSPCATDSDCGLTNEEYCCDGTCSNDNYCKTSPKIISAVASSISGSLFLIVAIFSFVCHRRNKRIQRRALVRLTEETTTEAQGNQAYQLPPPYQPYFPDYPPPEYEHSQTVTATTCSPEAMITSEQPPPYCAEAEGESGGVCTPQTSLM